MKEFIYNISILFLGINVLNKLIENGNKLLSSNYLVLVVIFFQLERDKLSIFLFYFEIEFY